MPDFFDQHLAHKGEKQDIFKRKDRIVQLSEQLFLKCTWINRISAQVYESCQQTHRNSRTVSTLQTKSIFSRISHRHLACRAIVRVMNFETLSRWADEELKMLIKVLPSDVKAAAERVPVLMEEKPGTGALDAELVGDELGLFEGSTTDEDADPAALPRIRLFLANLWDWVEQDEQDFRDEVGTTFLHELGHYLGWNEEDVNERGLE